MSEYISKTVVKTKTFYNLKSIEMFSKTHKDKIKVLFVEKKDNKFILLYELSFLDYSFKSLENKDYYVSNNKNNSNIKDMKYKKNTLLNISESEYGQYDDSISNDLIMAGLFIADYPIDSKNEINYSDSCNSDY